MSSAVKAASPRDPESIAWSYSRLAAYELQRGRLDDAERMAAASLQSVPGYASRCSSGVDPAVLEGSAPRRNKCPLIHPVRAVSVVQRNQHAVEYARTSDRPSEVGVADPVIASSASCGHRPVRLWRPQSTARQ